MRRYIDLMNEAFDRPSPWKKTSSAMGANYEFEVAGQLYEADFYPEAAFDKDSAWVFCFSYLGTVENPVRWGASAEAVHGNLGNMGASASRVFATVGAALLDFVRDHNPPRITFSGDKKNGRADFYQIMMRFLGQRIAAAGYRFERDAENHTRSDFAFVRVDESQVLDEMPISNISMHGDWAKNSGFKDQDRKLLSNPKAITKIKAMWKYPEEVDYNIMMVNNAEGNRHTEIGDVGDIAAAAKWLEAEMPKTAPELIANLRGDQVNIIYTNNKGSERVPMTGWIMAHRFGHAIFRARYGKQQSYCYEESAKTLSRYLSDLAEQYGIPVNGVGYGLRQYNALNATTTRNLMSAICTFKSARDGNLRNTFEALHELFAQYILNGSVKFNDIPKSVKVSRGYYGYRGGDDYDMDNRTIVQDLAMELNEQFETAVHYAVGKVYVM